MPLRRDFRLFIIATLLFLGAVSSPAAAREFALGADISGTSELEAQGITPFRADGTSTDNFTLMHDLGLNATRLRVWVNPRGGFCSPQDVMQMAKRAATLGDDIMIDFHYSDWWADPGKQNIPEAWKGLNYEEMKGALAAHTAETLLLLKENGIDVKWIQIGNETTNGFLWPMGRIEDNMEQYAGLTKAGYEAAKRVYPEAQVMVHLDNGYSRELYDRVFDDLKKYGCPWDAIGMSVYPFWSKRDPADDTSVSDIIDNIKHLNKKYGCDVIITEVGVEASKPKEGKDYLTRLLNAAIETPGCTGVFYWGPEICRGGYALGAFKDDRPTIIMDAFTEAAGRIKDVEF